MSESIGSYASAVDQNNSYLSGWIVADLGKNWLLFDNDADLEQPYSFGPKCEFVVVDKNSVSKLVKKYHTYDNYSMMDLFDIVDGAILKVQNRYTDWDDINLQKMFASLKSGDTIYIVLNDGIIERVIDKIIIGDDQWSSNLSITESYGANKNKGLCPSHFGSLAFKNLEDANVRMREFLIERIDSMESRVVACNNALEDCIPNIIKYKKRLADMSC